MVPTGLMFLVRGGQRDAGVKELGQRRVVARPQRQRRAAADPVGDNWHCNRHKAFIINPKASSAGRGPHRYTSDCTVAVADRRRRQLSSSAQLRLLAVAICNLCYITTSVPALSWIQFPLRGECMVLFRLKTCTPNACLSIFALN